MKEEKIGWKNYIEIMLACLLVGLMCEGVVSADRGMIPTSDVSVYGPGQKAIIAWNGEEELLILSTDVYTSESSPVLGILPLPSNPKAIKEGNFDAFTQIESLIRIKAPPYLGRGINITFHEKIGAHDITVVEVNDVQEFIQWAENYLKEHGIEKEISGDKLEAIVSDYIKRDLKFFVFDLTDVSKAKESIEPIMYRFESSFLYYPLKISKLALGDVDIGIFAITNGRINRSSISVLRIAEWNYPRWPEWCYLWHPPDLLPVEFSLTIDEVESISHEIAELFDNGACLTALTYEGPLEWLAADLKATVTLSSPTTIYVPDNYSTIQAAVNVAFDGDTIIVRDGTYNENIKVNKRLTIESENGPDKTIIRAKNWEDCVFTVSVDYVNISGFKVVEAARGFHEIIEIGEDGFHKKRVGSGSGRPVGIHLYEADYCNISNNIASNNGDGISLSYSSYNTITDNIVNANNMDGISLVSSSNNFIMNNKASLNSGAGIFIFNSTNNTLTNNTASNNRYFGFDFYSCLRNTLADNTANSNRYDGISLGSSSNNTLTNNTANANNGNGIVILYSSSKDNTLTDNSACLNNKNGIVLYSSSDNIIYLNNFINNRQNAYSYNSNNTWNSTEKINYTYNETTYENYLGNHWSDYSGNDTNNDGIGDSHHSINSDKDYYPLMQPYKNYFKPTPEQILIVEVYPDTYLYGDTAGEFIRIHNPSERSINIGGWQITDLIKGSGISFPKWANISAGDSLYLAELAQY